jgi:hypothetical protein
MTTKFDPPVIAATLADAWGVPRSEIKQDREQHGNLSHDQLVDDAEAVNQPAPGHHPHQLARSHL